MADTRIQSIDRAVDLMQAIAAFDGASVGVRELARTVDLKPATAQHLLKTLQSRGMLDFDSETKGYRIGLGLHRLAQSVNVLDRLADFVQPYVDAVFEQVHETVLASAFFDDILHKLAWRQPTQMLVVAERAGTVKSHHHMATGRAYLSHCSKQQVADYFKTTGEKAPADFDIVLKSTRQNGIAEAIDVNNSGVAALAAPVLDASGNVALVISCSGPMNRLDDAAQQRAAEALKTAAAQMSEQLAFQHKNKP